MTDGGTLGAGIVCGGGVGTVGGVVGGGRPGSIGDGAWIGAGTGVAGGACGLGTCGAVGLGEGAVGVSDEVGTEVVAGGPCGRTEIGGTRSIGGGCVVGTSGLRVGSDGPIAVD